MIDYIDTELQDTAPATADNATEMTQASPAPAGDDAAAAMGQATAPAPADLEKQVADSQSYIGQRSNEIGELRMQNEMLQRQIMMQSQMQQQIPMQQPAVQQGPDPQEELAELETQFREGNIPIEEYISYRDSIRDAINTEKMQGTIQNVLSERDRKAQFWSTIGQDPDFQQAYNSGALVQALQTTPILQSLYGNLAQTDPETAMHGIYSHIKAEQERRRLVELNAKHQTDIATAAQAAAQASRQDIQSEIDGAKVSQQTLADAGTSLRDGAAINGGQKTHTRADAVNDIGRLMKEML